MTDFTASKVHAHYRDQDDNDDGDQEAQDLPIIPKLAIVLNLNAAILTAITVIVIFAINNFKGSEQIYTIATLIPCFLIGSAVAVLSVALDHLARSLHASGAGAPSRYAKFAEIFYYSALSVLFASLAIFGWTLWQGGASLYACFF